MGNKYIYNGKDLQEELGLDVFDFEARMYDPAIGRTFQLDPHSDSYDLSGYSWVANNPLANTDPTGMDIVYGRGKYGGDLYTGADAQNMFRQLQAANDGGDKKGGGSDNGGKKDGGAEGSDENKGSGSLWS